VIGLDDGRALAPDEGRAQPLSVRVVDGDVYIHLPEELGAAA
jgi:nitrite reductase (NADH) small subunit